ncbi:MAG: twin-arginine translocase TatA/TatE family subunit [Alphaproteobacteria bacterium]|nr:twin-arginine translocase TatA/TatE family subunit [Alphaproteobacteria bacterium]
MFGRLGWIEILVIVLLVIVLFGYNKIPGMMKNVADGVKIFKKEIAQKPAEKKKSIKHGKKVEKK